LFGCLERFDNMFVKEFDGQGFVIVSNGKN
jgi:hypothetical protein